MAEGVMAASIVNVTVEASTKGMTTNTTAHPYDARGAMMFTVATILLYAMSIIAFIAGNLRRRHTSKEEEAQVLIYLKQSEEIQRKAVRDDVLRLRSQLLADSIISDNASHKRRMSRVERTRHVLTGMNCVRPPIEDERRSSTGSIELPACTIEAPTFQGDGESQTGEEAPLSVSARIEAEVMLSSASSNGVGEEASTGDDVKSEPEEESFLQLAQSGLPRYSLKESLHHSLLNGDLPNLAEVPEEGPDDVGVGLRGSAMLVPLAMLAP